MARIKNSNKIHRLETYFSIINLVAKTSLMELNNLSNNDYWFNTIYSKESISVATIILLVASKLNDYFFIGC